MCIALLGGMDRLGKHYLEEAGRVGIDLKVFSRDEVNIGSKIKNVDAMVIFTNKVSHNMKSKALKEARAKGIPVYMHHSCGICSLRECLNCLRVINNNGGEKDA
jgi:hypothetical protein